jgi:hypothetical protein
MRKLQSSNLTLRAKHIISVAQDASQISTRILSNTLNKGCRRFLQGTLFSCLFLYELDEVKFNYLITQYLVEHESFLGIVLRWLKFITMSEYS